MLYMLYVIQMTSSKKPKLICHVDNEKKKQPAKKVLISRKESHS